MSRKPRREIKRHDIYTFTVPAKIPRISYRTIANDLDTHDAEIVAGEEALAHLIAQFVEVAGEQLDHLLNQADKDRKRVLVIS